MQRIQHRTIFETNARMLSWLTARIADETEQKNRRKALKFLRKGGCNPPFPVL